MTILGDTEAEVYIYWHFDTPYVAIVSILQSQHWLAMFGMDGLMESAYIVENPNRYLSKPVFDLIGPLSEVLI